MSLLVIYLVAYVRASCSDLVLRHDMHMAAVIAHRALLRLRANLLSVVQQRGAALLGWAGFLGHLAFPCESAGLWSKHRGRTRLPKEAGAAAGDPPWERMDLPTAVRMEQRVVI